MLDGGGFLRNTQREIVNGRLAKLRPKPPHLTDKRKMKSRQIAHVVHGPKGFGRPIGLKERIATAVSAVDGVFVGIDHADHRLFLESVPKGGDGGGG